MDLGTIARYLARNLDVLNAALRLAHWLPWLQVLGVAAAGAMCGWLARGLRHRQPLPARLPEHIAVFGPTRSGKSITLSSGHGQATATEPAETSTPRSDP